MDLTDDTGVDRPCADCHADVDQYHLPGDLDTGWYTYYPAQWEAYYAPPWWYSPRWHQPASPGGAEGPSAPPERHVWTRDTSGAGVLPPGNANVSPPATTGKPADNTPQQTPKESDKDKEKQKEQDKDKRHVWGR
jgi:hypothetical protein